MAQQNCHPATQILSSRNELMVERCPGLRQAWIPAVNPLYHQWCNRLAGDDGAGYSLTGKWLDISGCVAEQEEPLSCNWRRSAGQ
jgi:hypothetical protein